MARKDAAKKDRIRAEKVDKYVHWLNSLSPEATRPLSKFLEIDSIQKFHNLTGTLDDFQGADFGVESNCYMRAQHKERDDSVDSTSERAGKDIPVEIVRLYGFSHRDAFRVVPDWGRDICMIPKEELKVSRDGDRYFYDRDVEATRCKADLYVVQPVGEDFDFWCKSYLIKRVAEIFIQKFMSRFRKELSEPDRLMNSVLTCFRFGSTWLNYLYGNPPDMGLHMRKEEMDTKPVIIDGTTVTAKISKLNLYINPRNGLIGPQGQHYIQFTGQG